MRLYKQGLLWGLLLLCCVRLMGRPARAEDFIPSVTPQRPVIVEAIDADGKDVTDVLVITPYTLRQEMQDYKIDHFEEAYQELTWDMIGRVLADTLTEDMNPRNLTIERLFYVHEAEDRGIVKLPVTLRFTTTLSAHEYCEIITYFESPDSSDATRTQGVHQWYRIPSINNGDGTITVFVDHYGPYAIVCYRVKEQPTRPEEPDSGSQPAPQVPHSPQTGERESLLWLLLPAAGIILGKRWLIRS